uniref:Uncharacterized protein n=1 Tax=Wolfiporia cocos TaxID=81056 RepID=A0A7G7YDY2_9APHY|nr:hypothetical protein [Wolfiporia cocos]
MLLLSTGAASSLFSRACLNYLFCLFYKNRIKTVPSNIGDLLTAVLALRSLLCYSVRAGVQPPYGSNSRGRFSILDYGWWWFRFKLPPLPVLVVPLRVQTMINE